MRLLLILLFVCIILNLVQCKTSKVYNTNLSIYDKTWGANSREWVDKICFQKFGGGIEVRNFKSNSLNTEILIYSQSSNDYLNSNEPCEIKNYYSDYTIVNHKNSKDYQTFIGNENECYDIYIRDCNLQFRNPNDTELVFQYSIIGFNYKITTDHSPIAEFHVFFLIAYFLIAAVAIYQVIILKTNQMECRAVCLFIFCISIYILSLISFVSNWNNQRMFNIELKNRVLFGNICNLTGNSVFIILIILITQGYGMISNFGTIIGNLVNAFIFGIIIVYSCTLQLIYASSTKGNIQNTDIENDLGEYRNPINTNAGMALIAFYFLIILYFLFGSKINTKKDLTEIDPKIEKFIKKFKACFTLWLITIPVFSIASIFQENDIQRFAFYNILGNSINLIFFLIILNIYHPCPSNIIVKSLNEIHYDEEIVIVGNQTIIKKSSNDHSMQTGKNITADSLNFDNVYNR